jgi:hypothetical protein
MATPELPIQTLAGVFPTFAIRAVVGVPVDGRAMFCEAAVPKTVKDADGVKVANGILIPRFEFELCSFTEL